MVIATTTGEPTVMVMVIKILKLEIETVTTTVTTTREKEALLLVIAKAIIAKATAILLLLTDFEKHPRDPTVELKNCEKHSCKPSQLIENVDRPMQIRTLIRQS